MGALHQGHLSLVKQALENNNLAVVSIFVNPTQFDNAEDLKKYPRTLEKDAVLLNTLSKDIIIYAPTVDDIYEGHTVAQHFSFDGLEHEMEGKFRDGHFDGVGTIVKRLFEIVTPNNAYFGEKDFQQLAIIKKLVEKNNIPVKIWGCKIHRESSGLAMSSRNTRLKPEYEKAAPFIYKTLMAAQLEYFIIADVKTLKTTQRKSKSKNYRAFIAVYADDIRLIDNIALN
ncbi:UNVERIFIED_CONTAM: hypothetical protein GTU68_062957 [Idotea baltica]|nr:hypothetical protein [Idotea baltica]